MTSIYQKSHKENLSYSKQLKKLVLYFSQIENKEKRDVIIQFIKYLENQKIDSTFSENLLQILLKTKHSPLKDKILEIAETFNL